LIVRLQEQQKEGRERKEENRRKRTEEKEGREQKKENRRKRTEEKEERKQKEEKEREQKKQKEGTEQKRTETEMSPLHCPQYPPLPPLPPYLLQLHVVRGTLMHVLLQPFRLLLQPQGHLAVPVDAEEFPM
jgi:ATPase subunit of ABC transporter with duplicated ATPase domains